MIVNFRVDTKYVYNYLRYELSRRISEYSERALIMYLLFQEEDLSKLKSFSDLLN